MSRNGLNLEVMELKIGHLGGLHADTLPEISRGPYCGRCDGYQAGLGT